MQIKPFRRTLATPLKDNEKKTATRVLGNFADFFAGITDSGTGRKTTEARDVESSDRTERRSDGKGSRRVIVEKHVHHHYHDKPEHTVKKKRRVVEEDDEEDNMMGFAPTRNILLEDEKGNDTGLAKKLKKHRDISEMI